VDLIWDSIATCQQGLIDGDKIFLEKKKQGFTFGTLFCGIELLGAAWESGTHVFSIEKMNQRKTTRPKAHSIYQRMGEAPWGRILKSWLEIVVVNQPRAATLRYEWMEHLMPRNMVVDRPDRVLVVGTVEYYMTVKHKVWEKQLAARGYDPTSWLVYEEDCGSPTRGSRVETLCIRRGSSASRTPLPFYLVAAERLPPQLAYFALMDYNVSGRAFIKKSIQKGRNPLFPNYVGHIGRKPVYEANGPLDSMDDILIDTERRAREVTT
jgi:hypothetical protein